MSAEARLVVSDLRVVVTDTGADVVDEVAFSLDAGETLGLVGESGSGKTTVALALLGHARRGLTIDGGTVIANGIDLLTLRPKELQGIRGSRVAYVPQDPASALNPALKIGRQLRDVFRKGRSGSKDGDSLDGRVKNVLAAVRLDEAALSAYPHQLSGGQQQRAAIAMAFALRPGVIVLDEPTTGLDVTTQRHVLSTIRTLCADEGIAAIFVSHDLAVIGELADRVAVMYAGRVSEIGTIAEVFNSPKHPYTVGLLGAVPSTDRAHPLTGMEGEPPRPGERPAGCFFAPRCPYCRPHVCTDNEPPLDLIAGSHSVRCVRAAEIAPRVGAGSEGLASARAAGAAVLTVRDLCASYGAKQVVHGVDLELDDGECLAVVGESGSGKTTLARCIVGLHQRWQGELDWRGQRLVKAARQRKPESLRAVQYVFQNPYGSLNPRKPIRHIVEQPLRRFTDLSRGERGRRAVAALEATALSASFLNRYPGELSGGERQRVAIARALVIEPEVLVCDEITSSLDVSVQAAIVEMLRDLQAERRLALIIITHNLGLVRSIADRVAVMHNGRFVEQARTSQVLDSPQDGYTKRLLADLPHLATATAGPGLPPEAWLTQPGT
jgi:peptide/nickel transport system ATP-binding protein